ncbi:MAG: CDP-diacylglycerol--serine O-phosphatidyltransferase [Burkholderiaceae bacterium]|nr:CDP-diacylglycerol--serine O-phosphatidyltransferase [Roseateles sp.]MBV8470668.1 CDP-diacylglycerol--serine O-phosphatidyltransferase [Burkholderiaceae bacterium]
MTESKPQVPVELLDDEEDHEVLTPLRPRRKGIYILPNLFTLAALFGGFYAIVMAMNGRFEQSAYGVFCAMVLDSLDGRVARMTNTQSTFGEQMDSLSDMVSFGAAPALIMYEWMLRGLGKLGWIAAFVYCAGAALRLARFNTNLAVVDKRFFQGLPSPAAAALVVALIWVAEDAVQGGALMPGWMPWVAFSVTLYAGLTMVTNAPFYSFKDITFKRSVPFISIVAIALGIAAINIDPPVVMFLLFCTYGVSGYVVFFIKRAKGKPVSMIATSTDEPDEKGLHH